MNSRDPHCWLLLLLLLSRLMGRLPIGCMGRTTASAVLACVRESLNQRSNPFTHLSSSLTVCVCPKGRGWRACERRRLVLGAACMDAPRASSAAPLAFAYASASSLSFLSLCSFSCPSAERPASQLGTGAPKTGQGFTTRARWELILKTSLKSLKIINLSLRIQFGEGLENY